MVQVHGLRVAFLGFTDLFNLNGNAGAGGPWVRGLDPAEAAQAVRAARAQADAVVVSLHWGMEYQHEPTARQREIARRLAEAGADLILGTHPHVLQPVEALEAGGRRALVAYSLGNFVSNQDRMYLPDLFKPDGGDSRDGVALQCRLVKRRLAGGEERVTVEEVRCEPLWNLNNWREVMSGQARRRVIRVLRVDRTIADLEARLPALAPEQRPGPEKLLAVLRLRRQRAAGALGGAFTGAP
jgi:poly-gamma-glutamate synthesis protein (capsule biosynthesis protein)